MKLSFNHNEGTFTEKGNCLLEVECIRDDEAAKFMFENGWLPFVGDVWYQCKSSRLKLSPISARRKNELSKIKFSETGNTNSIIERAKPFGCFKEEWYQVYSSMPNYTFFMDDAAFGIVNFFEDQIFYTTLAWDKNKKENSYGTLSYYHLIEKFRKDYEYMYISEYYEPFSYKKNLQGFQFWNGKIWKEDT